MIRKGKQLKMATKQKQKGKVPSEIGSTGVYSKSIASHFEDSIRDLTFPYSLETYDKMSMDVTIATALIAVENIASRVPIHIEAYDQTNQHQKRAEFVKQCFEDMDENESLDTVIKKALTFNKYGFSLLEKVFRRRRYKYGSKYDDGKIGIKYLPMRKQHSITEFEWDDDYRYVKGVYQNTQATTTLDWMFNDRQRISLKPRRSDSDTYIPKDRLLWFKSDLSTDNPESRSPLYYAYEGWRELQRYKDLENISASKNMNGILVGYAPEEYLSSESDEDMLAAGEAFKDGMTNVGRNEQACIVLPSTRSDEAHGAREWEVTTLQSSSSHVTSISAVVKRLQNEILQLMFADTLRSADEISETTRNKKSLLNTLVEIRIKEILRILNEDLIPELFRRNGWDATKTPKFVYGELEEVDMAVFAKAMQQLKATKLVPVTPQIINHVLEVMGFTYRVDDNLTKEELDDLLGVEQDDESRSGDGLNKQGSGTSDKVSEDDESASNLSNK